MLLDKYKVKSNERRTGRPRSIVISHSISLFRTGNAIDGRMRYDTNKSQFNMWSRYTWTDLYLYRFPSNYFIEQNGRETTITVGTQESIKSEWLNQISPKLDDSIFIIVQGDFSSEIATNEIYIRLGNIVSDILYRNRINFNKVFTLNDIVGSTELEIDMKLAKDKYDIELVPMKYFDISELRGYVKD